MSGQSRANRGRQQIEKLAQCFLGSACRSSMKSFWDGRGLLGTPGQTAGCLLCQGKAAAGGCDFQQLLKRLFLIKVCFELGADSEQVESSTCSAGAGSAASKGQPRL